MAVLGKRTLSKQPVGVRLGLRPRVLCLVVGLHVLKGGVGRVAGDQLGFTARVLAHSVTHRPTAGVPLTSDHKTQPEPNVATEHQEAYQEDEVDGLVVGGGACLLYFDQSGIMDTMIALQSLLDSQAVRGLESTEADQHHKRNHRKGKDWRVGGEVSCT